MCDGYATRNPSFRMSEAEVTPRMIALYDAVRRKVRRDDGSRRVRRGEDALQCGRFADASARFGSVIALLGPGNPSHGEGSAADDLLQLAHGFKDLADSELARARRNPAGRCRHRGRAFRRRRPLP